MYFLDYAFAEEEKHGGRVFVVYGNRVTLQIVSNFMTSMSKSIDIAILRKTRLAYTDYVLFGAIYTEDEKLPDFVLKLGAFRHLDKDQQEQWPTPEDWIYTPKCEPLKPGQIPIPNGDVRWTRYLELFD